MIGVLALQGGFDRHVQALQQLGAPFRLVKLARELDGLSGLILPGGESTTMLKLLQAFDLFDPLKAFCQSGIPVLGTCAGSILLCETTVNPAQKSLAAIPATIERNAYGSQRESFYAEVDVPKWQVAAMPVYFIRAPRFLEIDDQVQVICRYQGDICGVIYQKITAVTFHPELAEHSTFHEAWLKRFSVLC